MIRFVPEIHGGWIGGVKDLFLSGEIAYIQDSELLSALRRGQRDTFRDLAGCSAKNYLLGSRVGYALWLIAQGDLTGARAAQDAGFHDSSHLVNATRDFAGSAPKIYLDRLKHGLVERAEYDPTALLHALTRLPLKWD